jgi:hypothetical protein
MGDRKAEEGGRQAKKVGTGIGKEIGRQPKKRRTCRTGRLRK